MQLLGWAVLVGNSLSHYAPFAPPCPQVRTNAMKFLTNYFKKGQLSKLFFLFAVRSRAGRPAGGAAGDPRDFSGGAHAGGDRIRPVTQALLELPTAAFSTVTWHPACLQDPHFKAANHRRRIIQRTLLAE